MPGEFSVDDGKKLIQLVRRSIEYAMASGRGLREQCKEKRFLEQRGVFVTLHTFPEKGLRGCIGFPQPVKPLWNAVVEAAVQAAFNDPRFQQLQASEMEKVVVEVSVLTVPEEIEGERKELPCKIEVGKDGLIVKRGYHSGLLLPQVAAEQNYDAETFLGQCCRKAGLLESMWQQKATHVFRFQAQVFSEREPNGVVEETGH